MWGLTLLERNIRQLQRLGCRHFIVVTQTALDPFAHFHFPLPSSISIRLEQESEAPGLSTLEAALESTSGAVLAIESHVLNDPRVLRELLQASHDLVFLDSSSDRLAVAARLSAAALPIIREHHSDDLTACLSNAITAGRIKTRDLHSIPPYIENLRRELPAFLRKIETQEQAARARQLLELTVHKGVNDFVARFIHPPLEFGITKLLVNTPISPNQVTGFWLILAALALPLFFCGYVFGGLLLAAISGILDGVDGKLARLTLRYSRGGDLLDHVGNTIFDALWYLAMGWHFSGGMSHATGTVLTAILLLSYLVHRIVPGLFRHIHRYEIYDFEEIDKLVRLIGARMNNNIWLMLAGSVFGYAREAYFFVCVWMAVTGLWYLLRFLWVTLRRPKTAKNLEPSQTI